ncbi:MAG: FKBP-type peptidyl-prolyl cis-trans isomerase [Akkermansiaceae bacterium]|nr:FKBP-type peptidyl-prolyl cis-trans isomerase [Akkermansiaceae bacterium]
MVGDAVAPMTRKPYLIIVPIVVAIFAAIFIMDVKRMRGNELSRAADTGSASSAGVSVGDDDAAARPAKRKAREAIAPPQKIRTDSGLIYQVLKKGNGASPGPTDKVKVVYRGFLIDGTEFDSSPGDQPISFPLNQVIPGWTEGLQLMSVGAIYRFTIPPGLAYGNRAAGDKIPPDSTLIFEVELIAVEQ